MIKIFLLAGTLVLTGCATLDQVGKGIQTATAPAIVKETLPQICVAAKENRIRANDFYAGKGLVARGEVMAVNDGIQPRYRVYMRSGKISIHAGTENPLGVKQLTVGKTASVSGTIADLSYDYQGCSISLRDARF